jgi:hypothetical protein
MKVFHIRVDKNAGGIRIVKVLFFLMHMRKKRGWERGFPFSLE